MSIFIPEESKMAPLTHRLGPPSDQNFRETYDFLRFSHQSEDFFLKNLRDIPFSKINFLEQSQKLNTLRKTLNTLKKNVLDLKSNHSIDGRRSFEALTDPNFSTKTHPSSTSYALIDPSLEHFLQFKKNERKKELCHYLLEINNHQSASAKLLEANYQFLHKHHTIIPSSRLQDLIEQMKTCSISVLNNSHKAASEPLKVGGNGVITKEIFGDNILVKKTPKDLNRSTLEQEAVWGHRLNHPQIIKPSIVSDDGVYFPFAPYGDLKAQLNNFYFDYDHLVRSLYSCAQSLNYMHQKDIVHRDIKPDNFLIFDSLCSDVKLADLGTVDSLNNIKKENYPQTGTPGYIAPEVFNSSHYYDRKIDVWSFGILIFEMLTKSLPLPSSILEESCPEAFAYRSMKYTQNQLIQPGEVLRVFQEKQQAHKDILSHSIKMDPKGKLLKLVLKCLQANPKKRPSMERVSKILLQMAFKHKVKFLKNTSSSSL